MDLIVAPIFAFGFASPFLLWGLLLAGVPLLIHLLNKRRFRETQWAAMRFLLEAVRKNSRRIRIEQLILLAVRMLILALLVFAFARPQLAQLSSLLAEEAKVHKIVILDTSFSMGYEPAGQSRFKQAQQIARQIAVDAKQGDALNLVRISGSEPRVIIGKPSFRPDDVLHEIDQLTLPHELGDVAAGLNEALKLVNAAPEISAKEVYFISDFQRTGLVADSSGRSADVRGLFKKLSEAARLIVIDLGSTNSQNSAVTDFQALDGFATAGQPQRFRAAVATFGSSPLAGQTLEFFVDDKLQEQQRIDLQPGTESTALFTHTFSTPGEHRLRVQLAPDLLTVDDARYLSVPVKENIRVLCVNGKLSGQPRESATYHLELALAPPGSDPSASHIRPQVIKSGELRGFDLSAYDCVFLCNVGSFEPAEVEILESYLKSGGGIIWSLGDRVQAENYNRLLYRDGKGILPAKLVERNGNSQNRERSFTFDPLEFVHPVLNVFQGNPDVGLARVQTFVYFRTTKPADSPARAVLNFDNGDPAVLETRYESGRSILVTTSLDDSWSNWALWPSYVPVVQELVQFAVSGRSGERRLLVDEPLVRTVQTRGAEVSGDVKRPDGHNEPARIANGANVSSVEYDRTDVSGLYDLQLTSPAQKTEFFAVNIDPRESNLAKVEKEEIGQTLLAGSDFTYLTDYAQVERPTQESPGERNGISRWLLYAVLYLLFVEQMLAWNFQYGLWLAFPPALLFSRFVGSRFTK